jgi:hypothetical protein
MDDRTVADGHKIANSSDLIRPRMNYAILLNAGAIANYNLPVIPSDASPRRNKAIIAQSHKSDNIS